ncbi:MAG TPA: ABC transporter ATP-binding protein [Clostridiales bacterium]|jgi:zinc transport system ATP-binding protein|nr:ABC transporter ATP-binding protein [Clostridiales bacterium]
MAQIRCIDVTTGYGSHVVQEGLNFEVNAGDYLCIVGENGSGKSTLMRTILGLLPVLSGNIEFGDNLSSTDIGYLPQQTEIQRDFPASVFEVVLSGNQASLKKSPFYKKSDKQKAVENIERMRISNLSKKCYRELSGGQQQRVLLARALCATGKILLLDEPVAGLDPQSTEEMYSLIEQLNKSGITIIMISHDISAAIKYATNILHIGKLTFFGSTEEYIDKRSDLNNAEVVL